MTEPRTWSVSAYRAYRACPRQWWLSYVARVPQESGYDSIRGQVLHAGLAAGYREHDRATGEGRALVVAERRMAAAVEHAVCAAATRLDHSEVDEAIDTALRALAELAPQPGDEVLLVEQAMHIVVDEVPIVYRADAVYRRAGRVVVRDWKSRKQLPRRRELAQDRQITLGALCAARTFEVTEVIGEIASIGSAVAVDAPIDRSTAQETGRRVAETARVAETDRRFEPRPGSVCASCSVRAYCPVYANAETPLVTPETLLADAVRKAGQS